MNAWPAFRCGNLFVKEGTDSAAVFTRCGEPIYKEQLPYDESYIDKWIYGPRAGYYYILYFEAGKCIRVEEKRQ